MRSVYKFLVPFSNAPRRYAPVPEGAEVGFVGMDPETGNPAVWIDLRTDRPPADRWFVAYATGAEVPEDARYLGTAECGVYRWHVFERPAL